MNKKFKFFASFDKLRWTIYCTILSKGGELMSYQNLLEQVAKEHNTTPEEVDVEMRKALHMAGYDIDPALFISLAASKVKKTIYRN